MINQKNTIPIRLKQARESRGFTKVELAELVGVTRQSISQYEMGKITPSEGVLNELSYILKYPVDFFRKEISNSTSDSIVFFRSGKTTTKKNRLAASHKIDIFVDIHEFLSKYIEFPKMNLPKIDYAGNGIEPISNELIEEYAQTLREHWQLGNLPIPNLTNVAQKNGIILSRMNIRLSKIDAFSVVKNDVPFLFLGGSSDSNARVRFDIAHELGHLLMHVDYFDESDFFENPTMNNILEDEANRFAGAFLLPKDSFTSDVLSTSLDHFINLKKKWLASISSMIYRCANLEIFTENQIKYLKDQMTFRKYWRNEPLDKTIPVETPFAEKQAIELLLEHNILTAYDIVNAIACHPSEIEEYCCLEEGTLTLNKIDNIIKFKLPNAKTSGI